MKQMTIWGLFFLLSSCSSASNQHNSLVKITHLKMKKTPAIGKTLSGQELFSGGYSGLIFQEIKDGEFLFYALTDRGPNGQSNSNERPFLLPEFSPQIITLRTHLKENRFEVIDELKLKKKNGMPLSGLPNIRSEENPVDTMGFMYSVDSDGLDTEALCLDDEGGFWVGDEYGPSLVHFNSDGKMQRRLLPFSELPKMYSERRPNRGFEGIAKDKNKIYGFMQSPLPIDASFSRIVEVDLESMKTSGEYFYEFEKGMDKISDSISLGDGHFLTIEHNGKQGEESQKLLYKLTLGSPDQFVTKELLLNLSETPFKNLEKVEGLAVISANQVALVNDNDFQMNGVTDFKTGLTPQNLEENEMLILDFAKPIK